MNNDVFIKNTKKNYDNTKKFKPNFIELSKVSLEISSDEEIYTDMRNLFIEMNLDKENLNTAKWNPFSDFIKPGDTVLIKPNFVKHINNGEGTIDSLITNFSILRPIIDYSLLALNNSGKLIIGDSPVQECDFEQIKKINNLYENIEKYKQISSNIVLMDFRKNQNPDLECKLVQVNQDSSFYELENIKKEYSITNYDLKLMNSHHKDGKHEYIIPKVILNADVIINVPKPKTHRKAGMTGCMKNFVGINGNKECLPHHRSGGPKHNGDEFPENSMIKNCYSFVSKYTYKKNGFINFIRRILSYLLKITNKNRYKEGSWYGNDTIWRTILDLNKIIIYSDKNGKLTDKKQRIIFNIADMVISGEKEGPLLPTDKKVGLLVASFNQLNMDDVITKIMGFDSEKIKYIKNGYKLKKFSISDCKFNVYDENGIIKNLNKYNKNFQATDGWIDYLRRKI